MWCNPCRAVGMIHCAHPDECGNMLSHKAAADSWKAWLDDLPLDACFDEGIGRVQDFISGTVARAEAAEAQIATMIEADAAQAMLDAAQPIMAEACRGYEEQIAALTAQVAELKREGNPADHALVDKYRKPGSGIFNFPDDVAAIIRKLDAAEAERDALTADRDRYKGLFEIEKAAADKDHAEMLKAIAEAAALRARVARLEGALTDVSEEDDDKYLILKRGMYYRPNRQGYTSSPAEAGRYTLAQAVFITHPNGPDGPRDSMSFVPVAALIPETKP